MDEWVDRSALEVATSPGRGRTGPFARELVVARVDTEGLPTSDLQPLAGRGGVLEVLDSRGLGRREISTWTLRVRRRPPGPGAAPGDPDDAVRVVCYRDKDHQQIRGTKEITMGDGARAVQDICAAAAEVWPGTRPRVTGVTYNTLNATMPIQPPPWPAYAEFHPAAAALARGRLSIEEMAAELAAFSRIDAAGLEGAAAAYGGTEVAFLRVQLCQGGTSVQAEAIFGGVQLGKNPKVTVSSIPNVRVKGGRSLEQLALIRLAVEQILASSLRADAERGRAP